MDLLLGTTVAKSIKEECKTQAKDFFEKYNRLPQLAVILVGENPSSQSYVQGKRKACDFIGIKHKDIFLPDTASEEEVLSTIDKLNDDAAIDGILVQLPLPPQINEMKVTSRILPEKDVDGFNPVNVGSLLLGEDVLSPCTPTGVLKILDYYNIKVDGKNVCMVGRSNLVGKPMSTLLLQKNRNATITICHTHTKNLKEITSKADILIVAIGVPGFFKADMVKEGAVVIDVGITRVLDPLSKKGYLWKGDVDFDSVKDKVSAITPVPRGVGPMTIAMLMSNTLKAAFRREEKK